MVYQYRLDTDDQGMSLYLDKCYRQFIMQVIVQITYIGVIMFSSLVDFTCHIHSHNWNTILFVDM